MVLQSAEMLQITTTLEVRSTCPGSASSTMTAYWPTASSNTRAPLSFFIAILSSVFVYAPAFSLPVPRDNAFWRDYGKLQILDIATIDDLHEVEIPFIFQFPLAQIGLVGSV